MIIKLYDIQESISVNGTVDGSRFKRPEDTDLSFLSPIEFDLAVNRVGNEVWVKGPLRAKLSLACDRCLDKFTFSVEAKLDIELQPKEKEAESPEVELKTEDMNVYYFEGDEIDLDPYIFEEIMLNIPIKVLCSDACKGLCPNCGKNLNLEECQCEKTKGTVLGEKLKSFLKES